MKEGITIHQITKTPTLYLTKQEFDIQWVQKKKQRHFDNLHNLTGFYHGRFFRNGVGQPNEKR